MLELLQMFWKYQVDCWLLRDEPNVQGFQSFPLSISRQFIKHLKQQDKKGLYKMEECHICLGLISSALKL